MRANLGNWQSKVWPQTHAAAAEAMIELRERQIQPGGPTT